MIPGRRTRGATLGAGRRRERNDVARLPVEPDWDHTRGVIAYTQDSLRGQRIGTRDTNQSARNLCARDERACCGRSYGAGPAAFGCTGASALGSPTTPVRPHVASPPWSPPSIREWST